MRNAMLTMIRLHRQRTISIQWFRIVFIMRLRDRLLLKFVYNKADHIKVHMGLTAWTNFPDGHILKSEVSIAKNYLEEKEGRQLERTVTGFFDYIEDLRA